MVYNRTGYAPWSLTREAGVQSATVDGTIEVPQYIQPTIDTGFVDIKGNWKGLRSSDETFRIDATHFGVADNGETLNPQSQPDFIDMTGYTDLYIAIMGTRSGNCAIEAVMGPDTNTFANLTPVNSGSTLRGKGTGSGMIDLFLDSSEALTADVWNIFYIHTNLAGQKNLQFKITNTAGGNSDITFAYLRIV
jgi:hypothetical protein|tara:strand:+ start:194 stop:769 length:576 start_codon:yes stop_codon:yes gene_type:complete